MKNIILNKYLRETVEIRANLGGGGNDNSLPMQNTNQVLPVSHYNCNNWLAIIFRQDICQIFYRVIFSIFADSSSYVDRTLRQQKQPGLVLVPILVPVRVVLFSLITILSDHTMLGLINLQTKTYLRGPCIRRMLSFISWNSITSVFWRQWQYDIMTWERIFWYFHSL